jgi:hypothetical protein
MRIGNRSSGIGTAFARLFLGFGTSIIVSELRLSSNLVGLRQLAERTHLSLSGVGLRCVSDDQIDDEVMKNTTLRHNFILQFIDRR